MKLINNVTTTIRFFKNNIHEEKDFAARFWIHLFLGSPPPPEIRFFEYYQSFKNEFDGNVGKAFHKFLSENDTEIFTSQKFAAATPNNQQSFS